MTSLTTADFGGVMCLKAHFTHFAIPFGQSNHSSIRSLYMIMSTTNGQVGNCLGIENCKWSLH